MSATKSPYSTKFASGEIDYDFDPANQMRIWKREENATHLAPNTLPYEMGNLPVFFGAMVDNGFNACKTIESLLKMKNVENPEALYKLLKNTEKMVAYLLTTVDKTLEQYTIGTRHKGDKTPDYELAMYDR